MPNVKLTLGIVVGSLVAACFSANKPIDSTQTGNPPVIQTERVALRLSSTDARVIGEPGAVEPGGATVEITNLRTGETITTEAAEDGSFDVVVGLASDSYSVRAKVGGQRSSPVYVVRGTAAVGDGRDGSLSCEQRNTLAGELLTEAADRADRSCTTDSDCAPVVARASCYQPSCWFAYVSDRGGAQIERVSREIDGNLCAEYDVDACSHALPKCAEPSAAVCKMGQCAPIVPQEPAASCNSLALEAGKRFDDAIQAADRSCNDIQDCIVSPMRVSCREDCPLPTSFSQVGLDSLNAAVRDIEAQECAAFDAIGCKVSEPTCGDLVVAVACIQNVCTPRTPGDEVPPCGGCLDQVIEWGLEAGGGISDMSQLAPCARYQRHRFSALDGNEVRCEAELDACSEIASTGAIWAALSHPDVQALATRSVNPIPFGDRRAEVFKIRIGIRELLLGGSCDDAPPDCVPVPPGIAELRDLLQQIDQSTIAAGPCASLAP
jgi:hypothetical protein